MIGLLRALGLALLAGLAVAGPAFAGMAANKPPPGQRHTPAGMAAARRMLLTKDDVARSWTSSPAGKTTPTLTCAGFAPSVSGVVETGSAASPAFRGGSSGPFASEVVYVYATEAQARAYWRRVVVGRGVRSCLSNVVEQGSTTEVKFTVVKLAALPLPSLGARRAAYRLTATAATTAQTITAYVDMLLIGDGNGIAALSLSSFSQPVSEQLERALGRAAARRLAAGAR